MMKKALYIIILTTICYSANAQKWQQGYFYDVKGNKETGFIWAKPGGRGPIKDEAFIEFKENNKENPYKLSASDLSSYVVGRDSFVVAAEPQTGNWQYGMDFVKVALDEDIKLYQFKGEGNGGVGGGIRPEFEGGIGGGTGGYGGGVGAGISIPIGHGGGGKGGNRIAYYYGANTAEMKELTPFNFVDIMSDMMGDEPDIADAIRNNKYNLSNIDRLIADFEKAKASHSSQ
jgi:hypothetical protein